VQFGLHTVCCFASHRTEKSNGSSFISIKQVVLGNLLLLPIGFSMSSSRDQTGTESRPKDKSLKAYKEWVMGIAKRLTKDDSKFKLTEAEWIASWKEYWKERSSKL